MHLLVNQQIQTMEDGWLYTDSQQPGMMWSFESNYPDLLVMVDLKFTHEDFRVDRTTRTILPPSWFSAWKHKF